MLKYLLASATILISMLAASAENLPNGRSKPLDYIKVCNAYGQGYFNVPGTDTCLRVGGLVRVDTAYVPEQPLYKVSKGDKAINTSNKSVSSFGWELRGRVDLDARTTTEWGDVQVYVASRLTRTSGTLAEYAAPSSGTQTAQTTTAVLEQAYIKFMGFTAGAARDNFQFMPVNVYGAQHWAMFVTGTKQLAYTATFGNGFSATVAIQDASDTAISPVDAINASLYSINSSPQFNTKFELEQNWGKVAVMGAARRANGVDSTGLVYDKDKTVWAVGTGIKFNLPILAKNDALWITGAYADGMTEYTTAFTSFKNSNWKRDVGGFVVNHPSVVYGPNGLETVKSWSIGALMQHWWSPMWRSNIFASYGQLKAPETSKSLVWDGKGGFGDANIWSVGKNVAWVPTKDFEIGIETIYSKVSQDVRYTTIAKVKREEESNWTSRLRIERKF